MWAGAVEREATTPALDQTLDQYGGLAISSGRFLDGVRMSVCSTICLLATCTDVRSPDLSRHNAQDKLATWPTKLRLRIQNAPVLGRGWMMIVIFIQEAVAPMVRSRHHDRSSSSRARNNGMSCDVCKERSDVYCLQ